VYLLCTDQYRCQPDHTEDAKEGLIWWQHHLAAAELSRYNVSNSAGASLSLSAGHFIKALKIIQ